MRASTCSYPFAFRLCFQLWVVSWACHLDLTLDSVACHMQELGQLGDVSGWALRAAECYEEAGRQQPAAEALSKAARFIEETNPAVRTPFVQGACYGPKLGQNGPTWAENCNEVAAKNLSIFLNTGLLVVSHCKHLGQCERSASGTCRYYGCKKSCQ